MYFQCNMLKDSNSCLDIHFSFDKYFSSMFSFIPFLTLNLFHIFNYLLAKKNKTKYANECSHDILPHTATIELL